MQAPGPLCMQRDNSLTESQSSATQQGEQGNALHTRHRQPGHLQCSQWKEQGNEAHCEPQGEEALNLKPLHAKVNDGLQAAERAAHQKPLRNVTRERDTIVLRVRPSDTDMWMVCDPADTATSGPYHTTRPSSCARRHAPGET